MTIRGFGGGGDYPTYSVRLTLDFRPPLIVLAIAAVVLFVAWAARGGCSLPPSPPLDQRRDAICAALGRLPGCRIRVKDTIGARILSDETNYTVYIGTEWVGTWPIADGTPIDPALLTRDLVDYTLPFQMGDAELQQRLKHLYHCRRVAFIDRVLEWQLGTTDVLIACAS